MTRPMMMNYEIRADTEDLRDRIAAWAETNINVDWMVAISTWTPEDDTDGKWGISIDGGTVGMKRNFGRRFGERLFRSRRHRNDQLVEAKHRQRAESAQTSREPLPVLSNMLFLVMDQQSVKRGNSRDLRASQIEGFLREALIGGEKTVVALQEKARSAGLLGERQTITNSKGFRAAKAALGVRSHRIGFGRGAIWLWVLPAAPASEGAAPVTVPVDVYEVAPSDRTPETFPCTAESKCGCPRGVPLDWAQGVAILQLRPRPSGIPRHRWRLFVDDSKRFISFATKMRP